MSPEQSGTNQNVTSHNQSGGITAFEATSGPYLFPVAPVPDPLPPKPDPKGKWWKRTPVVVGGILAAAGAFVTVLTYFHIDLLELLSK